MSNATIAMQTFRIRTIRNRHESAIAACDKWLAGSLWGNPIVLSENNIHVYGAWRRRWVTVDVQFTSKHIVIVQQRRGRQPSQQ